MTLVYWQQILEDDVNAAAALLSIAPISVAVNDSNDGHEAWVSARDLSL